MRIHPNRQNIKVFLSYTQKDKELAKAILSVLYKKNVYVWNDQSIGPGKRLSSQIENALNECNSMIAILNEHSFSSSYVRVELQHALFDERYKNRLFPVFIGKSLDSRPSNLPWVLSILKYYQVNKIISPRKVAEQIVDKFLSSINHEGSNT